MFCVLCFILYNGTTVQYVVCTTQQTPMHHSLQIWPQWSLLPRRHTHFPLHTFLLITHTCSLPLCIHRLTLKGLFYTCTVCEVYTVTLCLIVQTDFVSVFPNSYILPYIHTAVWWSPTFNVDFFLPRLHLICICMLLASSFWHQSSNVWLWQGSPLLSK